MPWAPASPGSPLFCEQVPRSRANLSSGSCRRARALRALRPGVAGEPLPTAPAPDTLVPRRLQTLSLTSSRFPLARTTVASPHAVRVAHFLTCFCLVNWAAPPASKPCLAQRRSSTNICCLNAYELIDS